MIESQCFSKEHFFEASKHHSNLEVCKWCGLTRQMFDVGNRVHWTATRQGTRTLTMMEREGVIEQVKEKHALIRLPSGQTTRVLIRRLRRMGDESQITEFVGAVREANSPTAKVTKEHEDDEHLQNRD